MFRLPRVVTLALLVFLTGSSVFAQGQPKPAWPAILLSIVPGYGLGHFYCGDNGAGVLFLLGDITGGVVLGVGMYYAFEAAFEAALTRQPTSDRRSGAVLLLGLGIVAVSRIWEMADISRAIDGARKAGTIAEPAPMIDVDVQHNSFELGISLKY